MIVWKKNFQRPKIYQLFIIIYLLFISIVILFSVNVFSGYRSLNNISGSMSPAIETGSISVVKDEPAYNLGDAIAYYALIDGRPQIITHRIMGIGGNVYTTKGDANQVADREIVRPRLIIGRVVFVIPLLGYIIGFAKSFFGTCLLIIFPAAMIIFIELIRIAMVVSRNRGEGPSQ